MIPFKIKEHLDNYIHQEVYVQIAVIKGKKKYLLKQQLKVILTQIILETCQKEGLMIILSMD
jgi:hypothetical protein